MAKHRGKRGFTAPQHYRHMGAKKDTFARMRKRRGGHRKLRSRG